MIGLVFLANIQQHYVSHFNEKNAMSKLIPAALLAVFWGVLLVIFFTPPAENSTGFTHPTHAGEGEKPAMSQGGDGQARHEKLLISGWVLAAVILAMLVSMLAFATQSTGVSGGKTAAFAVGGLLVQAAMLMLFLTYRDSLGADKVAFIGSVPASTWWLLFGVYGVPYYFVVLYVCSFNRWIMTPESMQKFEALVAKYQPTKKGGH